MGHALLPLDYGLPTAAWQSVLTQAVRCAYKRLYVYPLGVQSRCSTCCYIGRTIGGAKRIHCISDYSQVEIMDLHRQSC